MNQPLHGKNKPPHAANLPLHAENLSLQGTNKPLHATRRRGHGLIATPHAPAPAGIVAITLRVLVSITETLLLTPFAV
jgi:hypothetical protein